MSGGSRSSSAGDTTTITETTTVTETTDIGDIGFTGAQAVELAKVSGEAGTISSQTAEVLGAKAIDASVLQGEGALELGQQALDVVNNVLASTKQTAAVQTAASESVASNALSSARDTIKSINQSSPINVPVVLMVVGVVGVGIVLMRRK